jgi:hypothetical protein
MKKQLSIVMGLLVGAVMAAPSFGVITLYQEDFDDPFDPVGTAATALQQPLTHVIAEDTGQITATTIDVGNSLGKTTGGDDGYHRILPGGMHTLEADTWFEASAVLHVGTASGVVYFSVGAPPGNIWAEGTRVGWNSSNGTLEVVCLDQGSGVCNSGANNQLGPIPAALNNIMHARLEVHTDHARLHYSLDGGNNWIDTGVLPGGQSGADRMALKLHTGHPDVNIDTVSLKVVPEPASLALLSLGGLAMLRRRR